MFSLRTSSGVQNTSLRIKLNVTFIFVWICKWFLFWFEVGWFMVGSVKEWICTICYETVLLVDFYILLVSFQGIKNYIWKKINLIVRKVVWFGYISFVVVEFFWVLSILFVALSNISMISRFLENHRNIYKKFLINYILSDIK